MDDLLSGVQGILVPGGFGDRGIEGKVSAIRYAREQKIPFFGICLGMQVAVIEYARNVSGLMARTPPRLIRLRLIRLSIFCPSRRILRIWAAQCVLVYIRVKLFRVHWRRNATMMSLFTRDIVTV